MEQPDQLVAYIKQCLSQGMNEIVIRNQLLQSDWSMTQVTAAFQISYAETQQYNQPGQQASNNPHRVRNGILWFSSPFMLISGVIVIELLAKLTNTYSLFLNLLAVIGGLGFIILIPVGIIMGIRTLERR